MKPTIEAIKKGSIPDDGWYFTSYRLPIELAQAISAIAETEGVSFSNAVISLLKHAKEEYGAVDLSKSKVEPSKHAKPGSAAAITAHQTTSKSLTAKPLSKPTIPKPSGANRQQLSVKIKMPGKEAEP